MGGLLSRGSARDYAAQEGRGDFESVAAAGAGGPVYCGDRGGVARKIS